MPEPTKQPGSPKDPDLDLQRQDIGGTDKSPKPTRAPANDEPNQPGMGEDEDKDRPPGGKR
jgi:hypothetical protein